jgi:hypothetical protein
MKKKYSKFVIYVLTCIALFIGNVVSGQNFSDNASNYVSSWANNSNQGTGFGAWSLNPGASSGRFIGNPGSNGMGTDGIGTTAFGMFATGSGYFNAYRSIDNGIQVGDTFSFYWAMNWDAGGGSKGFDLRSGGTTIFNVNNGGSSTITANNVNANTAYGTTPMLVTITRTSAITYSFSMTSRSGGTTYTTTINSSSTIDGFDFYIGNQNDGSGQRNMYFNDFKISKPITVANGNWNVGSTWLNSSIPIAGATVTIANNINITNSIETGNLTIQTGASLTLQPTSRLKVNGNITNDAQIIFKSDATGSSAFDAFSGSLSGSGNVQVERYIPAKRAFRFLSPSVTTTTTIRENWQENGGVVSGLGTHITGTGPGFDTTATNNPSMFTYTNGAWAAVTNTNVDVLTAGTPYRLMVRGDRTIDLTNNSPTATPTTLRATGTLRTGNFSPTLNQAAEGFSFIGNPYQAPLDMRAVLTASINMNKDVLYYWDPTINNRGGYVTRTLSTSPATNNVNSNFTEILQPGQAVFVKKDNIASTATMTISETHKAVTQGVAGVFRTSNTLNDVGMIRVNLQANVQNSWQTIEGTLALFNDNFSWNVTPEDATKMSNLDEEVSFVQNNTSLAIACVSAPSVTSELPIQLNNLRHSNYQWQFELANYQGERPYLFDAQNNTYTEITNGATVPFTATTAAANRFKIVFQPSALNADDFTYGLVLYPNPAKAGDSFYVQGSSVAEVTVYNVLGQNIPVQVKSQGNALQVTPAQTLSQGIYLVTVTTEGKTQHVKWIVE